MNMTGKCAWVVVTLMGLSLGLATGQQKTQESPHNQNSDAMSGIEPTISSASDFQQRNPRYRLEPGDSFEVFFELSPEFNQTATIQPDGYATLRGIDDLRVANRTMPELTELLRSAYAQILHEPRLKVVLKDFEKPYFIADGQVGHPGKYELRGDTTLTQGIAMSGGFLDSAKHSQVLLFRRASEGWFSARIVDVKKMQKEGNLHEDPQLHPGDMLFVPKNRFSKIKPFLPGYSVGMMVQPY